MEIGRSRKWSSAGINRKEFLTSVKMKTVNSIFLGPRQTRQTSQSSKSSQTGQTRLSPMKTSFESLSLFSSH